MRDITQYLKLFRIDHWIKNGFLIMPIFFSGDLFDIDKITKVLLGFIYFSLTASSIYIINDIIDCNKDANHPVKKFRPLASKSVSTSVSLGLSYIFIIIAFIGSNLIEPHFQIILILYYLTNLCYSFGLKDIAIIDVFIIAIGFVFRVEAGAILGGVSLSMWLNLMVFLLSLFLALGKRRDDVILKLESGVEMRKSTNGYNLEFLNIAIIIICTVILVCYLMYTISPEVDARLHSNRLYYTSLFVFLGILRYLQLIFVRKDSGSPTKIIYRDPFIQVVLLLWILSFFILIYLN